MDKVKRSILPLLLVLAAIFGSWAIAAKAQAYLHVANAQSYAVNHVWVSFCNQSSYWCWRYPYATGWYQRISDSYVRVEIAVGRRGYSRHCTRVFAVRGSDGSPYITSDGSAPYYSCPY